MFAYSYATRGPKRAVERAIAFSEAIGRPESFIRALPEARLGPLEVALLCYPRKRVKPKRTSNSVVVDFMRRYGIPLSYQIPHPNTFEFEERRVLEALDVQKPLLEVSDYYGAWGDVLRLLPACSMLSLEECLADVDSDKSAGEPWRTTKGCVLREFEKREPVTVWLTNQQHRDLVQGMFMRHTKEELRDLLPDYTLKDPHSISGIEFFAQLMQNQYCGQFNEACYDLGSQGDTWFSPGQSFYHGQWDKLARYHHCDEDRAYLCWDFRTNNETHDYNFHCAMRYARTLKWKGPILGEERRVWDFDWDALVCLPSGVVVPVHQLNSGSFNTTVANTFQCKAKWDAVVRLMERKTGVQVDQRKDKVAGDDGLTSFSGAQADIFTAELAIQCARELGMDLKCKSARHISAAQFCSHTFVQNHGQYVAAPLEPEKIFCSLAFPPVKATPAQILSRFVAQQIRSSPVPALYDLVQRVTEEWVATVPADLQLDREFQCMLVQARQSLRWWMVNVHLGKPEGSGERLEALKVSLRGGPGFAFSLVHDKECSCSA